MEKLKSSPIVKLGFYSLALVMLFFIYLETSKFCFTMMNASDTITFGLGVSLLVAVNIFNVYAAIQILKKIIEIYKTTKSN